MKQYHIFILVIFFCFTLKPSLINAQKAHYHDSTYYTTYPGSITPRIYLSQKYGMFVLPSHGDQKYLKYSRNSKVNMGIGASYRRFSVNVAYGFNFLNPDHQKDKTTSIDLQLHMYRRKWIIDALGIYYKGFYPKGSAFENINSNYYRPDAKMNLFSLAAYRFTNGERFSYRAAMVQDEWQKKSAGSLLFGGQASYGIMKGDSAIVPKPVQNGFTQAGINKINFLTVGPGAGYAYTLVIKKHFFVTASLIGSLGLNFSSEQKLNAKNNRVAVNPATIYKASIGYNSSTWDISTTWAGNALWVQGISTSERYFLATGNYRVILAKKINIKKH
ncbi:MAG TPA: DUF4421 domain-containing protein [Chitinophagaceae bacterium]|jgi:hypothetical protein